MTATAIQSLLISRFWNIVLENGVCDHHILTINMLSCSSKILCDVMMEFMLQMNRRRKVTAGELWFNSRLLCQRWKMESLWIPSFWKRLSSYYHRLLGPKVTNSTLVFVFVRYWYINKYTIIIYVRLTRNDRNAHFDTALRSTPFAW